MKSYVIADRAGRDDAALLARVTRLSELGADCVQLRDRNAPDASLERLALSVRKVVSGRLLINSHRELASRIAADGVHFPADAAFVRTPGLLAGRSCHTLDDCRRAAEEGFDYVVFGPVFATRSKRQEAGVSLADLRIAARLGPELFALGGMSLDTLPQLRDTGIAGIAAITLYMQDEPLDEIMEQVRAL